MNVNAIAAVLSRHFLFCLSYKTNKPEIAACHITKVLIARSFKKKKKADSKKEPIKSFKKI